MSNSYLGEINGRTEKAFQEDKKRKEIETAWLYRDLEAIGYSWSRRHRLAREEVREASKGSNVRFYVTC